MSRTKYAAEYAAKQTAVLGLLEQLREAVTNMTPAHSNLLTIDDLHELGHIQTDLSEILEYFTPSVEGRNPHASQHQPDHSSSEPQPASPAYPAHPSNVEPQNGFCMPRTPSQITQELQRRENILRQILRTNTPSQLKALSASLRPAPASSQSAPCAVPLSFANPTTPVNP